MPYTPQPGSVPQRVLEYMRGFSPGDEFPTGVLAQRLMITSSTLITSMETAKRNGLVKTHKAGKTTMWSLGDGTPEPGPDASDIRIPRFGTWSPPKMVAPRPGSEAQHLNPPVSPPQGTDQAQPETADTQAEVEVEETEREEFNAAAWADGDVDLYGVIELDDGGVRLTAPMVAKLKRLIAWSPAA